MPNFTTLVTAALLLLAVPALTTPALAAPDPAAPGDGRPAPADKPARPPSGVMRYDTNKDGRVHKDVYFGLPKSNQRYWDSVDINSDE